MGAVVGHAHLPKKIKAFAAMTPREASTTSAGSFRVLRVEHLKQVLDGVGDRTPEGLYFPGAGVAAPIGGAPHRHGMVPIFIGSEGLGGSGRRHAPLLPLPKLRVKCQTCPVAIFFVRSLWSTSEASRRLSSPGRRVGGTTRYS